MSEPVQEFCRPPAALIADYNKGLDAALAIIDDRKQHWKAKRANKGFPIGMVETELRLVEEKIQARRTA